jgi:predicted solute-binding protein
MLLGGTAGGPETLKTDERRLQDELSEHESFVKIGDPALQMVGDDFAGALDT